VQLTRDLFATAVLLIAATIEAVRMLWWQQPDLPHRAPGCQDVVLFVVAADYDGLQNTD